MLPWPKEKRPLPEKSHVSAKLVTSVLQKKEIYKDMRDLTLVESHTSAKPVTSSFIDEEI